MSSPDLGGGRRLRRRPGSLFIGIFVLFLLLSASLPSSIPEQVDSGVSESFVWARRIDPPFFTALSTVRTPSRSPLANASGSYRPPDLELHRILCFCRVGSAGFRSEVTKLLTFDFNLRSDPSSSLSVQRYIVADLQLHYYQSYCKRSLGLVQPGRMQYSTSKRLVTEASIDFHRRDVQVVPIEAQHCCHRSSRRVRYNSFTPTVLNLLSKLFLGNVGSNIYGINGVPVSIGIATVSTYFVFWQKPSILDGKLNRLCTGSIIGLFAQFEHSDIIFSMFITGELLRELANQTLSSQKFISDSPEAERRRFSGNKEAVRKTQPQLGQHWINLLGHGPSYALLWDFKTQVVVISWPIWPFVRTFIGH